MSDGGAARISPTAHYTGYIWARHGLSHPELETLEGRLLYESLRPPLMVNRLLGGAGLEHYLLARHLAIDRILERAIEEREITQVVEVACGLSPRGWRFQQRYGDRITYIEADLAEMADRKRAALERMGTLGEHHRVQALDALRDEGPQSLASVVGDLPGDRGLAIITEGLLGYLPPGDVRGLWRRFAATLSAFRAGAYLSDLHVGESQPLQVRAFRLVLSGFVRGQVYLHWGTVAEAREALLEAGFTAAELRRAASVAPEARGPGAGLAHIIDASTA